MKINNIASIKPYLEGIHLETRRFVLNKAVLLHLAVEGIGKDENIFLIAHNIEIAFQHPVLVKELKTRLKGYSPVELMLLGLEK